MIKAELKTFSKSGLHFILGTDSKPISFKPWLSDGFSFFYDSIMQRSIFPKKFAADIVKHVSLLRAELGGIHGKKILELATGTGSASGFIASDNAYFGIDISPGLLKKAIKKFRLARFENPEFYVASATELPFQDSVFDVCLCILSFNFFPNQSAALSKARRVLSPGSVFICVVPVPERNAIGSPIRGTLYSERDLSQLMQTVGFKYERIVCENGALLYFRGIKPYSKTGE